MQFTPQEMAENLAVGFQRIEEEVSSMEKSIRDTAR